jgi:membrane protein
MTRAIVSRLRTPGQVVRHTIEEFLADRCPQMAAAISFYALLSLPPLLVLVIMLIEPVLEPERVEALIQAEVGDLIGPEGAEQVRMLIENVSRPGQGGILAAVLGTAAFLFGATAAFGQLQAALNAAWQVGPDPERGDVMNFLLKRALSFAMIIALGALLLGSLVISTLLSAFADTLEALALGLPSPAILRGVDFAISFTVLSFLFAAMYRFLPDARVRWASALRGGLVTALLFAVGKFAIGHWLGRSDPGSAFGAAGSLAMLLLWIYYSAMILLLGAEITQVWMRRRGEPIEPKKGAIRVIIKQERYQPGEEPLEEADAKR